MSDRGTCFVLFPAERGVTSDQIAEALTGAGLEVEPRRGCWRVRGPESAEIDVVLVSEPHVVEESQEIAELFVGPEHRPNLARCDARIELSFELEPVLDETNTLIETQCALQKLTGGYLFNSWNQSISPPDP